MDGGSEDRGTLHAAQSSEMPDKLAALLFLLSPAKIVYQRGWQFRQPLQQASRTGSCSEWPASAGVPVDKVLQHSADGIAADLDKRLVLLQTCLLYTSPSPRD